MIMNKVKALQKSIEDIRKTEEVNDTKTSNPIDWLDIHTLPHDKDITNSKQLDMQV